MNNDFTALGGSAVVPWIAQIPTDALPPQFSWLDSQAGHIVINIVSAIVVLIVGWLLATVLSLATKGILQRTQLDNRFAGLVFGDEQAQDLPIEKWAATAVYYVILVFTVVACLNALNLAAVSQPLNTFLERIFAYLPQVGGALAWLLGGWLLATAVKLILTRGLQAFRLDDRLASAMGDESGSSPVLLNENLGKIAYWFILLFFLYFALGTLGLSEQLAPIENTLTQILDALPQILTAILIGFAGWVIARVARGIVSNLLATTGVNRFGARFGLTGEGGRQTLSTTLGTVTYAAILILTAIAALEELNIEAISEPAIAVLDQVLNALPRIFAALGILIAAYLVGQFVSELVTNILTGIGFNNVLSWLGLPPVPAAPPSDVPPATPSDATTNQYQRTPSEVVGIVALVGIMLLAVIAAVNLLEFEELTELVSGLSVIFGRIIAGVVVFAIGLYLANLAFNLIGSSGGRQARFLAQTARIVIIGFVSAMALQQIGIAPDIVNLAFGLIGGAIAVAFAIAFGVGGRDVAAEAIRSWLDDFKRPD